jgi:hypothetical protein
MANMEKPTCGSEKDAAVYDFPLHVAAVCKNLLRVSQIPCD